MYERAYHKVSISDTSFLVTGGAGFIGSNIVEYLLKHNAGKVIVLDNLSTGLKNNLQAFEKFTNFQFVEGDICDLEKCHEVCKQADYVLHQAALGSVPRSINNPIATNTVNVSGFLNILVAARDAKVKRVIYASSSSVYGDSKTLPKKEEEIGKPLSPYAVSKLVNEQYAAIFSSTYQMEIIGLRYFNIFGPRQSPEGAYAAAIPLFINHIMNDEAPVINGDGLQTRDFTFVENAVQANIKALFAPNDATNRVYNIAVGEKNSLLDLISCLNNFLDKNISPLHREDRFGDVRNSLADISMAKQYLEYEPEIKFEQGLSKTVEWFGSQTKK